MQNYGATLNIQRQILLPFSGSLSQKSVKKIAPTPIGRKIKSFKIDRVNSSPTSLAKTVNPEKTVRLPNFVRSRPYPVKISVETVATQADNFSSRSYLQPTRVTTQPKSGNSPLSPRFWWHLLLLVGSVILMLPILFQTSSEARNLLERAKIYIELDSSEATSIPDSGRIHLHHNQASAFNRAIRQTKSIKPDSPFYPQAQEDILRWSEVILDIAQGRANREDWAGAIAAARLVPQDESSVEFVAQQAAEAVEDWQLQARRQKSYQNHLAEAKMLINPSQASSYIQAIGILKQIPPGVLVYQEAQSLIEQWSQQIYLIADYRASQGDFQRAIAAAALVPKDSFYYHQARQSMTKWLIGINRANQSLF